VKTSCNSGYSPFLFIFVVFFFSKKLVDLPPLPRLSQGETLSSLFGEGETKGETKKPPPPPHPGHPSNNSNHGHEAASKWRRAAWVVGVRRYNQKKNANQQLKRYNVHHKYFFLP
jgi:hypothetical protein